MPRSTHPPEALELLSPPVAAYVEATNGFDLERLLALFADDALVNDQLRDYWGKPAIREWAVRDIVGQSLTMDVTAVIEHYGNCIVTANVRGKFDMTGLPDPLVYALFTSRLSASGSFSSSFFATDVTFNSGRAAVVVFAMAELSAIYKELRRLICRWMMTDYIRGAQPLP